MESDLVVSKHVYDESDCLCATRIGSCTAIIDSCRIAFLIMLCLCVFYVPEGIINRASKNIDFFRVSSTRGRFWTYTQNRSWVFVTVARILWFANVVVIRLLVIRLRLRLLIIRPRPQYCFV